MPPSNMQYIASSLCNRIEDVLCVDNNIVVLQIVQICKVPFGTEQGYKKNPKNAKSQGKEWA